MDILLWRGHLARPETLQLYDDLGRTNFSCILEGTSCFAIQGLRHHTDWELAHNRRYITHTPDCRDSAPYCGRFESITLSFNPKTLALRVSDISAVAKNRIDSHYCCQQHRCNVETHLTAQALRHAPMRMHGGFSHEQEPSTPWLQGQSLVMFSLVLDEHREDASCLPCHLNSVGRQKLPRARDLPLADLTQAPGVTELARESGLSVLKIRQDFHALFDNSVYGLSQVKRIQKARRCLASGNTSVMTVVTDLGYANASHFSAAFQKQFGVTPSTFRRGM